MRIINMTIAEQCMLLGTPIDQIVWSIISTGGAVAFVADEGMLREAPAPLAERMTVGPALAISPDFWCEKYFSPEEIGAILLHEEGHIRLGHLTDRKGIDPMDREFEADSYAASIVGPDAMIRALEGIGRNMRSFAASYGVALDPGWEVNFSLGIIPRLIRLGRQ